MNQTANNPQAGKVYRVAQWAAGRIGRSCMRAVIGHPQLELVGLYVFSESKAGCDAGELAGVAPIGVKATRNINDIIALKPDCVMYMQEGYDVDDMCRLLEAGINIVTTRSEFFYTKTMDPAISQPIEAACQKGNSSLFATGSSPGFSTEVLPLAMTYMSRRLDCLTIDEFADIPASTTPDMITNIMGFGRPMPKDDGQQRGHATAGFSQSLEVVADAFGIKLDGFETFVELAAANSPIELPGGAVIEKGTIAAQRITTAGMVNGKPKLQFRANWYCSKDIDQNWELGNNGWRVQIEGDTPMDVNISFPRTENFADQMSGLTAHPAVNAAPYVCEAAAGIRTNADMPVIIPKLA